jgi:hypothetical protein
MEAPPVTEYTMPRPTIMMIWHGKTSQMPSLGPAPGRKGRCQPLLRGQVTPVVPGCLA